MLDKEKLEDLALEAKKGNINSFGEIYDILIEPIYNFVYHTIFRTNFNLLQIKEISEDLTEDVFVKVWDNIGKYEKIDGAYFSSWVYQVASNIISDYFRKSSNKQGIFLSELEEFDIELEDESSFDNIIQSVENKINSEILRVAISKLNQEQKEVLILKYLNDFSYEEISEITKKPEGTIRQLNSRGIKNLKSILSEQLDKMR